MPDRTDINKMWNKIKLNSEYKPHSTNMFVVYNKDIASKIIETGQKEIKLVKKQKYNRKYSVSYTEENTGRGYFETIYLYPHEDENDLDLKIKAKIRSGTITTYYNATEQKI